MRTAHAQAGHLHRFAHVRIVSRSRALSTHMKLKSICFNTHKVRRNSKKVCCYDSARGDGDGDMIATSKREARGRKKGSYEANAVSGCV